MLKNLPAALFLLVVFGTSPGVRAENGVTDKEILLGQSAALTGPAAELGKQVKAGAEAYFKVVNNQGGVHGRKIRLVTLDDGYEPDRAAANTQKLIEQDKVFALFGFIGTPTSNAAKPIFTAARVPFFAPITGAASMRSPVNRNIFNVRSSYLAETHSIVGLLSSPQPKNIAVFYQNDAYGQAGLDGVQRALLKTNNKPVALATVERNSTDVSAAVQSIAKVKPDAIIIITAYKSSAAFIREMKQQLPGALMWNVSFVGSRALADELGDAGRGVGISQVVPFPWDPVMQVTKEHQKEIGAAMSFTTLEGFIAAKVFVEGVRKAGKALTREGLIGALENAGKIDVGGFEVQYSPESREGSKFVDLTMISRDRKFIR